MISRHKKAIMYEFLVRLVIALIFIFGAFYIVKSIFRLSSTAEESFNKLVTMIDNNIPEGQTTTMTLSMDQGTAIALFNPNANEINFGVKIEIKPTGGFGTVGTFSTSYQTVNYILKRPETCSPSSSCACLCKKVEAKNNELSCLKSICKTIKSNTLPLYNQSAGTYPCVDSSREGSIFLRGIIGVESPRVKTIYATNYNSFTAICEKVPCPPEEIRKDRITVSLAESKTANYVYQKNDLIKVDSTNDYLDIYYYITDLKKDVFNIYYYEYKSAIGGSFRIEPSTKEVIISEQAKDFFEEKRIENLNKGNGVTVMRPSQNPDTDIKTFKPNWELQPDGTLKKIGV